ncbi:hypothetical protein GIB67_025681 [Kingdonia uniflora]|uniref:Kinesin motor domain-containing protein n=1 Tax=Kingdonia uniflora TaxID=39325 RepID=A0A7J7L8P7_9MAGN|nr:hypothetical protein GIB67_025681 [Kingdonia uniflora]
MFSSGVRSHPESSPFFSVFAYLYTGCQNGYTSVGLHGTRWLTTGGQMLKLEHTRLSAEALEYMKCIKDVTEMTSTIQSARTIRVFCRCRPLTVQEASAGATMEIDFDYAKDGEQQKTSKIPGQDPDKLEVGNGGMTFKEYRAHFSIWALMKPQMTSSLSFSSIDDPPCVSSSSSDDLMFDCATAIAVMHQNTINLVVHDATSSQGGSVMGLKDKRKKRDYEFGHCSIMQDYFNPGAHMSQTNFGDIFV